MDIISLCLYDTWGISWHKRYNTSQYFARGGIRDNISFQMVHYCRWIRYSALGEGQTQKREQHIVLWWNNLTYWVRYGDGTSLPKRMGWKYISFPVKWKIELVRLSIFYASCLYCISLIFISSYRLSSRKPCSRKSSLRKNFLLNRKNNSDHPSQH